MVCLGLEPRAAGWKVQTNPLSYGGIPSYFQCLIDLQYDSPHAQLHWLWFWYQEFFLASPLFRLFLSLQTHITNFTTNTYVKKCPSSIRCWDSNSWPLEHESPPITTRPGLLPLVLGVKFHKRCSRCSLSCSIWKSLNLSRKASNANFMFQGWLNGSKQIHFLRVKWRRRSIERGQVYWPNNFPLFRTLPLWHRALMSNERSCEERIHKNWNYFYRAILGLCFVSFRSFEAPIKIYNRTQSIQSPMLGFKLMAAQTRVSSHNH